MATATYDLHERIQNGVVTVLRSLTFDGIDAGRIYNETVLEAVNFEMPCIVVSIEGEAEKIIAKTTCTRQISYPVRVFALAVDLELSGDDVKRFKGWRATAMDAFDGRRRDLTTKLVLPDCPEVFNTKVTPRVIFDERLKQYRHVISGFVVEAEASVIRPRGGLG